MYPEQPQLLTPTLLADARLYSRCTLPVFGPNVREWVNGEGQTIRIEVTEDRLPRICEASNRPWRQTFTPARLSIGHVRPGFVIPEKDQPRNVGYTVNFRIAPLPTGQKWIWADLYQRVSETVPVADYPFRSADYDPVTGRITGVALLRQDPFLDQGVVHYQRAASTVAFYSRGSAMTPSIDPNEEVQYAKVCAYMKQRYPKLAAYMEDPSSTNAALPGEPSPTTPYQKTPEYSLLEAENQRLTVERDLDALAYKGVRFDRAVESTKLVGLEPAKRAEHIAYMLANYSRVPVPVGGCFIPVVASGQLTPADKANAPLSPTEMTQATAYQKETGCEYPEAVKAIKAKRQ